MSFFNPFVGENSSETIDLSEYAKKEDLVGQKTTNGGEIFNDYENNMAVGDAHAEGKNTKAQSSYAHAEGGDTKASGKYSHAEGCKTIASDIYSHAEGYNTGAFGNSSHAEGNNTKAYGKYSHAEGDQTTAGTKTENDDGTITYGGDYSHAEGGGTTASGDYSHTEGNNTTASGYYSHAEGQGTAALNNCSHAEGYNTTALGIYSHAEGFSTKASGNYSHAEGVSTTALGNYSHAEGRGTKASSDYQHVQGKFNIEDAESKFAFIIGNGSDTARSNAFAIDWNGLIYLNNSSTGIDLTSLKNGSDGREIELQTTETMIQWRYVGDETWTDLIALSSLKGDIGEQGPQGYTPQKGVDYWTEEDIAEINAANQAFAAEEVAKVVAGAPEEFDTLKEMSEWLLNHEESAAAMNVEIQSLKTTKANAADVYNKTEVDTKTNILETTKVDKVSIPSLTQEEYDALTEKTALYYFIKE